MTACCGSLANLDLQEQARDWLGSQSNSNHMCFAPLGLRSLNNLPPHRSGKPALILIGHGLIRAGPQGVGGSKLPLFGPRWLSAVSSRPSADGWPSAGGQPPLAGLVSQNSYLSASRISKSIVESSQQVLERSAAVAVAGKLLKCTPSCRCCMTIKPLFLKLANSKCWT